MPEKEICDVGERGIILPLFGDAEQRWPNGLRAILYCLGLGWCFMGVALISDVFMGAIEKITSKKIRKTDPQTNRHMTVHVWNPTVANLTLMALGSSAPEILLSCIELLGNEFYSGDLGPSTIVGSAAFNLFCITAVCVSCIPEKEVRFIKEMPVYTITSASSILAYLWLLIILEGSSKNIVEIWEGVLTFLFFPIMVFLAFLADKGYFSKSEVKQGKKVYIHADMTKEELAELEANIRRTHGAHLTDEQVAKFIECEFAPPPSRAQYRVNAVRNMTGGKRVNMIPQSAAPAPLNSVVPFEGGGAAHCTEEDEGSSGVYFEFEAVKFAVLEDHGDLPLTIRRRGNTEVHASVSYRTRDGTAKANADYKPLDGRIDFPPGVDKHPVTVCIIDDAANEDDEEFYLELFDPHAVGTSATIGEIGTTTVVIIDDDLPGCLDFEDETLVVPEEVHDVVVDVKVVRTNGSTGKVGCKYQTEDGSAIAGADYEAVEGMLEFESGQMSASIKITVKGVGRYERSEIFRLVLHDVYGGARFDPKTDGGAESSVLTVEIKSDAHAKARVDKLMSKLQVNWHKAKVGRANWREQFVAALYVNGGDEDEDTEGGDGGSASIKDWIAHVVLLPWKLLFALVPPTDYLDGWVCFVVALIFIGMVTAVVGDMANLFGCVLGVPTEITAITFVALGTSLPDTFASKTAATQDPYADNSLGNVTGSNSVNVFLGLGLPWMIGAVYWTAVGSDSEWKKKYANKDWAKDWTDGAFVVEAGVLTPCVMVFSSFAVTCLLVLYVRRRLFNGELGGPTGPKYATSAFLVSLWFGYIGASSYFVLTN